MISSNDRCHTSRMLKILIHLRLRQNFFSAFFNPEQWIRLKKQARPFLLYINFEIQFIFPLKASGNFTTWNIATGWLENSNNHEILRKSQGRLKSMTDLIGMEVRSERTTLIKTGDWSPDLLWAARFHMMGISTNGDRSSLNGRSWQNALIFTVIASYFITSACLLLFTLSAF